jgi:DNA-binding response OmpR family regulator
MYRREFGSYCQPSQGGLSKNGLDNGRHGAYGAITSDYSALERMEVAIPGCSRLAMVHRTLRFGPFELSGSKRVLWCNGVTLPLGGRAFDILVHLAERPGEVIGKNKLINHVWSNVTVEEASLRVHISARRSGMANSATDISPTLKDGATRS